MFTRSTRCPYWIGKKLKETWLPKLGTIGMKRLEVLEFQYQLWNINTKDLGGRKFLSVNEIVEFSLSEAK